MKFLFFFFVFPPFSPKGQENRKNTTEESKEEGRRKKARSKNRSPVSAMSHSFLPPPLRYDFFLLQLTENSGEEPIIWM